MTTLSDGITTVTINPDLVWADEYAWTPVESVQERTITGGLVIQQALRVAGRPITLSQEDPRAGWITRTVLEQLRVWAGTPDLELTLVYRGVARTVSWRQQDGTITAVPVADYSDAGSEDFYRCTLRFQEH